jgi:glycosyltransferase involved in cell wall biosynthesis
MRLLLVHQNFPGQFRDLAPALADRGHELRAIGCSERPCDPRIPVRRYRHDVPERQGLHQLSGEVDDWIRRAELAARQAEAIKREGWAPDVILAHPGWGESLLLREVFAASPLLLWPELWLRPEHMGIAPGQAALEQLHYLRTKNWLVDGALADATAAVVPTAYQASTFPERWQGKLRLIHEGVQPELFALPRLASLYVSPELSFGPEVPLVTFISRNLEPMRGFPVFMRALPRLQALRPDVQVVIVGGEGVSYSSAPGEGGSWKAVLLQELEGQLDLSRVHFFGRLPHHELIKLYRRSNLHVYLSAAFVLSWSLTELLACGTPVLAGANPMLEELIEPGVNGALWQGNPEGLAVAIGELLADPARLQRWGEASRQRLQPTYHQSHCVEQLEKLLGELAGRF